MNDWNGGVGQVSHVTVDSGYRVTNGKNISFVLGATELQSDTTSTLGTISDMMSQKAVAR